MFTLSFKPAVGSYGDHDPSAALFEDSSLIYGVEEERFTRVKHANSTFPRRAIQSCLEYRNLELSDVDRILLPYDPPLQTKIAGHKLSRAASRGSVAERLYMLNETIKDLLIARFYSTIEIERALVDAFGEPIPPIETREHHACHAASAFHPSGFDEALVLTIDGRGEYDSTVVWNGTPNGVVRHRTYEYPNSLGHFFGAITEYLGYRAFNGEGKVMGLAPYGSENEEIESTLRDAVDLSGNYDVTAITSDNITGGVDRLESLFDRPRKTSPADFSDWEKDLAFTAQKLLEEVVVELVDVYCDTLDKSRVALAGGVALNCKINKRVMEMDRVEDLFIQPVAHDAGLAVGAGFLDYRPSAVPDMTNAYWGPAYSTKEIEHVLRTNKVEYDIPEKLEETVAGHLADGQLVGWFQGRMEMGPRALGNRSILADPRTVESRDRVNEFVKHRENWRPFAPSMLESAVDTYLHNGEPSPYMIKTFDVVPDRREELEAVIHPGDGTTRPQTVNKDQNPRYFRLIKAFESQTGVPVVLNTSFNDHAEPIVMTPTEAIKDFFAMGLDLLAIGDVVVEKS